MAKSSRAVVQHVLGHVATTEIHRFAYLCVLKVASVLMERFNLVKDVYDHSTVLVSY